MNLVFRFGFYFIDKTFPSSFQLNLAECCTFPEMGYRDLDSLGR